MATDNAPIKNTCPKIDDMIASLTNAFSYVKDAIEMVQKQEEPNNNAIDCLEDAQYHLTDFIGKYSCLEDIRSDNAELRNWGNEQYDRVQELEQEVYDLQRKIDEQS